MQLATDKKMVIPVGYQAYRYNIKYILHTKYSPKDRRKAKMKLCIKLNIGENMFNKYANDTLENKKYNLSPEKLKILSTFFDCSIDDLNNDSGQ